MCRQAARLYAIGMPGGLTVQIWRAGERLRPERASSFIISLTFFPYKRKRGHLGFYINDIFTVGARPAGDDQLEELGEVNDISPNSLKAYSLKTGL